MKKWEYKAMIVVSFSIEEFLNGLGKNGWELVYMDKMQKFSHNCIFKREIIGYTISLDQDTQQEEQPDKA